MQENLESSLLATGFPPDTLNSVFNNMESFRHITNMCHGVRRDGSAALDLCFVASGRLDGFWERKLSPWDVAAGSLIVTEAGGRVTSLENGPLDMKSGHILATNGHFTSKWLMLWNMPKVSEASVKNRTSRSFRQEPYFKNLTSRTSGLAHQALVGARPCTKCDAQNFHEHARRIS